MTSTNISAVTWAEDRATERSVSVQRSRARIANQVKAMLDAARRLIREKGDNFTTQELAKEAGVALQTFYRYFSSKDELLVAVIGDAMTETCAQLTAAVAGLANPLDRLRFIIASVLGGLGSDDGTAGFIVSAHWQLLRAFPDELTRAERPFVDLVLAEVNAATDAGLLRPADPQRDAWFVTELLRAVYHYYTYAPAEAGVEEHLWRFCLTALGGTPGARMGSGDN